MIFEFPIHPVGSKGRDSQIIKFPQAVKYQQVGRTRLNTGSKRESEVKIYKFPWVAAHKLTSEWILVCRL